jgi:O-antigen/teichoic acid export membrane protein
MPFGFGLALFAPDLVHFAIGDRWEPAIVLIQAFAIVAALDQVGFNWTAFLRAVNQTRPLAVVALLDLVAFAVVTAPLMIAFGLPGLAIAWIATQAVTLLARTYYLTRLFSRFRILPHAVRAIAPAVTPVALVMLARVLETGDRTPAVAAAELAVYVVVTLAATIYFERELLREVLGYLRRPRPAPRLAGSS